MKVLIHGEGGHHSISHTVPLHLIPISPFPFYTSPRTVFLFLLFSWTLFQGCAARFSHYDKIFANLQQGNFERAEEIVAHAESRYGSHSKLLYLMDRGMTLHLAGKYQESMMYLEQANAYVEDLYTRHVHQEAVSFLVQDAQRPFRGDPYEQVFINVINALNYARLGNLQEALVEARRIDHRLNVLADTAETEDYHEDPFARYLTGMLYEAAGDLSNAFVAYRKAYDAYQLAQPWSTVPMPETLKRDLLRITYRLNLLDEHAAYRQAFSHMEWSPPFSGEYGEIVVIGYHGRAPRLEDQFIDVPVSVEALALLLQTKPFGRRRPQRAGGIDAVLYGLQGEIVRIALPRVVPQKSRIRLGKVRILREGHNETYQTEEVYSVTAAAQKNLSDRMARMTLRAVARAAFKMATAEGIGYGVSAAAKEQDTRNLIQAIVSTLLKVLVLTTEEADKRSWRTLPDVIHLSRIVVPPGTMTLQYLPQGVDGRIMGAGLTSPVTLGPGETKFVTVYAAE